MLKLTLRYITDETGKKLSVIIPIDEFNHMIEQFEEAKDILRYDEAKATNTEPSIPIEDAFKMIDQQRKLI